MINLAQSTLTYVPKFKDDLDLAMGVVQLSLQKKKRNHQIKRTTHKYASAKELFIQRRLRGTFLQVILNCSDRPSFKSTFYGRIIFIHNIYIYLHTYLP